MPALRMFGRRWNLGSDDFVFPGVVEIVVRTVWILVLVTVYLLKRDELDCDSGPHIHTFYIVTLVILVVQVAVTIATVALSARGTIKDTAPRRHVSTTIYLRLLLLLPEIGWSVRGAISAFREDDGCQRLLVIAARGVVIVEWIIIATIIVSFALMFDPLGRRHMRKRSTKDYQQIWRTRCRVLCCCVAGDDNKKNAFEEIADLLTKFFKGKDIVLTDILAGLVLLSAKQKFTPSINLTKDSPKDDQKSLQENDQPEKTESETKTDDAPDTPPLTISFPHHHNSNNNFSSKHSSSSSESLSSRDSETVVPGRRSSGEKAEPKEWMTLENAEYYSKYAVGSYAAYNYVMCRNCGQRGALCRRYKCCYQPHTLHEDRLSGDNSCDCQTAALLQYTAINTDDVIYANFENQIYETPYFIALDDSRKSVIIAIRGTKTFQDAVTDLTAFGDNFDVDGIPPGNVHGGILKVARNILEQLEKINFRAQVPEGYNVILTGHSLGAGAAVILSMLLRKEYPLLRCFAYSPPGGLVSLGIQMYTESFVCSVVLGNDLVPRLSMVAMEKFKYNLLKSIKRSGVAKYKILKSGFLAMCCGNKDAISDSLLVCSLPTKSSASSASGILANASKASIATTKLFDIGDVSTRSVAQYLSPQSDNATEPLHSRPSEASLTCNTDSDAESVDSQLVNVRRTKDEDSEGKVRPTTYHQFHKSHNKWKKDKGHRRTGLMVHDPLYLPGHVMHIVEQPPTRPLAKPTYSCVWASAHVFTEIVVCPNMLHHHHGYVMRDVLQQMMRKKRFIPQWGSVCVPTVLSEPEPLLTLLNEPEPLPTAQPDSHVVHLEGHTNTESDDVENKDCIDITMENNDVNTKPENEQT